MAFDPVLILYQIISLQCFHYLAMGTLLGICHTVFDLNVSLDHFFTGRHVNFVTAVGWTESIVTVGAGIAGYDYFTIFCNFTYKLIYLT